MKKRILVLGKTLPLHDRASGDFRLREILRILASTHDVDFLYTTHVAKSRKSGKLEYIPRDSVFPASRFELLDPSYAKDLTSLGVRVLGSPEPVPLTVRPTNDFDIRSHLAAHTYDLVWVEFYYLAERYLDDIRRFQPSAAVVCDSVDLHFRRLARQCNYMEGQVRYLVNHRHEKKSVKTRSHKAFLADQRRHADHVRDSELRVYQKCDAVAMVSEDDSEELRRHLPNLKQLFVPNIHRKPASQDMDYQLYAATPFERRQGCVFVGNFDHNPNVSSAIWLKHEVAPHLADAAIRFQIVGSNPPRVVRTMGELGPHKELFQVTGWVPDTMPYLSSARVSVAPILFGAGMNGKIGEALAAGVPVVTTWLGAQGMQLVHEETCLVADDPAGFAAQIRRLHDDQELWEKLRENGLRHLESLYSDEKLRQEVLDGVRHLLASKARQANDSSSKKSVKPKEEKHALPPPAFPKAPHAPKFSVIVLAHNHWPFTELCLRSLAHAERANPGLAEYILVDNASADGTPDFAARVPGLKVIANAENLGFAGGNNAGIDAARGENIVLLNNDTIVPPGWLAGFAHYVDNIPSLGVLGPSTNTETGQGLTGADYSCVSSLFRFNERLAGERGGSWEKVKKVSGLCLVIPRAALEKIGRLDPDFGVGYFEDDDFCLRAEDAGLTVAWAKDIYVHHFGSVSFGGSKKRARFLEEGMARFAFKWGKRGLDHISKAHEETLLRSRRPRGLSF